MEQQIINKSFKLFDDGGIYVNFLRLYFAYFESIPNIIVVNNIDDKLVKTMLLKEFHDQIEREHYRQNYEEKSKTNQTSDYFIVLKNKLIINIFDRNVYLLFHKEIEPFVFYLQQKMIPFIKQKAKTKEINFIVSGSRNLYTKEIEIKRPKVNIDLHYNDDFKEVHQIVLKTLRKNKTKGLFLFHGIPGTGKSTYIKSLILQLNKKVIFLSPKIAANLDNMAFTEFLIDNPNIVLVIEDAEDLIISRENNQNSQLSFLLNLTDGLIADSLGIQIIATFNTDLKNIDKALLRKGRLTAIYEFGALHFNKANQLLKHLNIHDFETMQPMILADIFNYNETNFNRKREKSKIGF
jgi:hypothetical protein